MTLPVDVERLTVDWCIANSAIGALIGDRIYTAIPRESDRTFPLARLTRVGGAPGQRLLHLDTAVIQFDVWGGPKATARTIADTIRSEMDTSFVGSHDLGVVTDVSFGQFLWLPDETFDPAKPRYVFDVTITVHP